jgi:hypothetical protein
VFAFIVLAALLLAFWFWSLVNRDGSAAFMQPFVHVPLIAAVIVGAMAIGAMIFH